MENRPAAYGTITFVPPASPVQEPTQSLVGTFCWTSLPQFHSELPTGFSFDLQCWRRFDGVRYFLPATSSEWTIRHGFAAGMAILSHQQQWGAHERFSYRAMYLLMRQLRGLSLRRKRKFQKVCDLFVRDESRRSPDEWSVLPSFLLDIEAFSGPGQIQTFLEQGDQAARAAGIESPTVSQKIHYGLFQAAQAVNWQSAADRIPMLIRNALFDESGLPDEPIGEETWGFLEERILTTIWPHLEDDENTFASWFQGARSSFVKQIAQQKKAPGGQLSKEQVRQFLMEIGWKGYFYVAQCLEAVSRDFGQALQDPLTEPERRFFERLYSPQQVFGGLPFLLLWERMPDLSAAAVNYLNGMNDTKTISTLHLLLMCYAQMSDTRRATDRQGQQKSRARRKWKSPGNDRSPTS
ncbi:MAG TPA: hypothetical protein VNQ76_20220 [Planctomicrobium sp.]|nr:hypothetical protein [Planctomicrobium sp.]